MFYEVIPIRIFRAGDGFLTYSSDLELLPGHIVEIPLGRGKTFGIITKKVAKVDFPTKPITRLLYDIPLPTHIIKSIFWLSDYYLVPLPLAAKLFLPQGLGKKRRTPSASKSKISDGLREAVCVIDLNPAQKHALKALEAVSTPTKLLHGVTGSGKTNI